jgi:DNA replication initiation complex subunit (GINS family)
MAESKVHEEVSWRLFNILQAMDDRMAGLGPEERELYFQIERYCFPEHSIFAPENLEATHQRYLDPQRTLRANSADATPPVPSPREATPEQGS